MEKLFKQLSNQVFSALHKGEILSLSFKGESSQFIRLTQAKIRQTGLVDDAYLGMKLIKANKTCSAMVSFSNDIKEDTRRVLEELERLRGELSQLLPDPFIVLPTGEGSSREIKTANGLSFDKAVDALLPVMQGVDLVGIWASGKVYYGAANSLGQHHWFETDTHSLDYSLVAPNHQMVKGTYAGTDWDQEAYEKFVNRSKKNLKLMEKKTVKMKPGEYRTWFGPHAVFDFIGMFSWYGLSEASIRQGCSGFGRMRNESVTLSPKFSLDEDFTRGLSPRFNSMGEVAETSLPLIKNGQLTNTLTSSRTASEYGVKSNRAETGEYLRSPVMASGDLNEDDVLSKLDTGLFLSNIHYLNWSDNSAGRITGLTRYACFWVEGGVIAGPIETMRFDDTFYRFFGTELEAVGSKQELIPDVLTYEGRNSESVICPGILVKSFSLTL